MRRLLVAGAVLLGLLVFADRVAEHVAEGVLADQLADQLGARPSVEIGGFPFVTQALRGRYDDLRLHADRVDRAGLVLRDVTADLSGARVPLSEALTGSVRAVPVARVSAGGVVAYADLPAADLHGLTLAAAPTGVRVSGTVRVLGQDVSASAVSSVRLEGSTLAVAPTSLQVGGVTATGAVAAALRGRLDLRVPLGDLPYGVRLSSVTAGPEGLRAAGTARDLVLQP